MRTTIIVSLIALICSGCSTGQVNHKPLIAGQNVNSTDFLPSGTIILSHRVPERMKSKPETVKLAINNVAKKMAPLLGYFPPQQSLISHNPADNEIWLEVDKQKNDLSLYRGKSLLETLKTQGEVALNDGRYFFLHKQRNPRWYAPDSYFSKRLMDVPPTRDKSRYRRGALGEFALYTTDGFAFHSAPVWSAEVGGLKLDKDSLSRLFDMVSIGTPIVIK